MVVKIGSGRWRCGWEVQEQNPRNFPQIGKTDGQEQHERHEDQGRPKRQQENKLKMLKRPARVQGAKKSGG
jgi:hypothetical protein